MLLADVTKYIHNTPHMYHVSFRINDQSLLRKLHSLCQGVITSPLVLRVRDSLASLLLNADRGAEFVNALIDLNKHVESQPTLDLLVNRIVSLPLQSAGEVNTSLSTFCVCL
jgi:hypothetical protein